MAARLAVLDSDRFPAKRVAEDLTGDAAAGSVPEGLVSIGLDAAAGAAGTVTIEHLSSRFDEATAEG